VVNAFQIAPALLAGVAFYVGVFHLLLFLRIGKTQRISLTFAIFCFTLGIYDILCVGLYLSNSYQVGADWQRFQLMVEGFGGVSLLWFYMEFTASVKRRLLELVTIYMVIMSIFAIFNPDGFVLQMNVPDVKVIQLTSSFQIIYYEVASGPLKTATYFVILGILCYSLWIAIRHYRLGHKKEARPLIASVLVLFACGLSDILVVSGVYDWIYMTEYGFIGMVLLMTFTLSNTVVDSIRKYRQLFEDAAEISEMKSKLITFATHELKTPLVPIIGWAELLKSALEKGKKIDEIIGPREVDSIANSAHRLGKIIETFLEMGHLESRELPLNIQPCQIADIISNAIENVTMLSQSANITIHSVVENALIDCDTFRMEQVIINILSNSIKYSPQGTEVWITTEISGDNYIIRIQDQGFGFTPEDLKNVWHPFSRALSGKTPEGVSTGGIGLFLSKTIVELHGGTISIGSPGPDLGSTVTITIPLKNHKEEKSP
jgi:signal transduction histidine kinase